MAKLTQHDKQERDRKRVATRVANIQKLILSLEEKEYMNMTRAENNIVEAMKYNVKLLLEQVSG
jgi:hypothetical protein